MLCNQETLGFSIFPLFNTKSIKLYIENCRNHMKSPTLFGGFLLDKLLLVLRREGDPRESILPCCPVVCKLNKALPGREWLKRRRKWPSNVKRPRRRRWLLLPAEERPNSHGHTPPWLLFLTHHTLHQNQRRAVRSPPWWNAPPCFIHLNRLHAPKR